MEELIKFTADNYESLYEIYSTQGLSNEMTFETFCMNMFIAHLKNK